MTIIRNGIEYELTDRELYEAHRECERRNFIEDVRGKLEELEIEESSVNLELAAEYAEVAVNRDDNLWDSYWRDIEYGIKKAE